MPGRVIVLGTWAGIPGKTHVLHVRALPILSPYKNTISSSTEDDCGTIKSHELERSLRKGRDTEQSF